MHHCTRPRLEPDGPTVVVPRSTTVRIPTHDDYSCKGLTALFLYTLVVTQSLLTQVYCGSHRYSSTGYHTEKRATCELVVVSHHHVVFARRVVYRLSVLVLLLYTDGTFSLQQAWWTWHRYRHTWRATCFNLLAHGPSSAHAPPSIVVQRPPNLPGDVGITGRAFLVRRHPQALL